MKTLARVQGTRRPDGTQAHELLPSEYALNFLPDRTMYWVICTPNGIIGNLLNHKCHYNDDGTLSCLPPGPGEGPNSILAQEYVGDQVSKSWHGFIYAGEFREIG